MGAKLRMAVFPILAVVLCFHFADAKPLNSVINVDVYLESLCPDSRRFVIKQLRPTYEKLEGRINLRLIPYGNAEVTGGEPGTYQFKCQHGPDECYGNIAQACVIELLNDTKLSLDFAFCAFHYNTQEGVVDKCIGSEDIRYKVKHCADGPLGKNLEYKMAKLTEALNPPQTFIPWITVNNKGSRDINNQANTNLLRFLCEQFKDDVPSACTDYRNSSVYYRRFDGL